LFLARKDTKKGDVSRLPLLISFNYMFIQQLQTIQHQL